jgi:hypothetical protein
VASKNVLHEVLDESDVLVVNGGTHDDQLEVKMSNRQSVFSNARK